MSLGPTRHQRREGPLSLAVRYLTGHTRVWQRVLDWLAWRPGRDLA